MSPSAQRVQLYFVRLAAEEPSSLYFEAFLREGFDAWPSSYQLRFPGFATWQGVAALKQSLRTLAGAADHWSVILASRSLSLVKLAAGDLFRVCRHVLTTDLSWPTYQETVESHARQTANRVTVVPLRSHILDRQWTVNDVAGYLATAFHDIGCDGLFLPAVDHLGVRLPIREIVRRIELRSELRYCAIDAAQAFCQVPLDDCFDCADFIVAGSHKWLGAYLPSGIAFVRSIRNFQPVSDDPLLDFTERLEGRTLDGRSETANLTPLFACAGAATDWRESCLFHKAIPTVQCVQRLITASFPDWRPIVPARSMRSRIMLFETEDLCTRQQSSDTIRQRWLDVGFIVTAYVGGRVRVALPHQHAVGCVTLPADDRFTRFPYR